MVLRLPGFKNFFKSSSEKGEGFQNNPTAEEDVVKEVFIYPHYTNGTNMATEDYAHTRMSGADYAKFNWNVPNDFKEFVKLELVIRPDSTEVIQWDIDISLLTLESISQIIRSAVDQTKAVTADKLTTLDLKPLVQLGDTEPNTILSVNFQSDTTYIYVLGLKIVWR